MERLNRLGALIVATAALSATLASDASASTFLSHPTGKLLGEGGLVAVADAKCSITLITESTTTLLSSKTLSIAVKGKLCELHGSPATFETLKYSLDASGSAKLTNTLIILGSGCKLTVPSSKNQALKTIKFDNRSNGTLLVLMNVANLVVSGEGAGMCSFPEEETILLNEIHFGVEGGALRWDA